MVDYRAHIAVLEQLKKSLSIASSGSPLDLQRRKEILTDIANADGYSQLGALIDHLFTHAVSDGTELELLKRASDMWQQGTDLYNNLTTIRANLESALDSPTDPASAGKFNQAALDAQLLASRLNDMQAEITGLRDDIDPLPHLPPHPRQKDKRSSDWDWGNLLLGRRTDAFVRNITTIAKSADTKAFAFGVLSSYSANATGSAYLGHTVGGPRRAHRYRDRIARNAVGSWIGQQNPTLLSTLALKDKIAFGTHLNPALPANIKVLIQQALKETFDESHTQAVPDFDKGYTRLLNHLELLDTFKMPEIPPMPSGSFITRLYGDPGNPPPTLRPQDVGVVGQPGGGVAVTGGSSPGTSTPGSDDSKSSSGSICAAFIALLIFIALVLVVAFVECIIQWAKGNPCNYFETVGDILTSPFKQDPPDSRDPSNPGMTSEGLTAFASTEQAAHLVGYLFDIHIQVWEGLNQAYNYLAITGLIYPDEVINLPRFKQFLTIPNISSWPHRPESDPLNTYHLAPVSPIENPVHAASTFPLGSTPESFLTGLSGLGHPTAVQVAVRLWNQMTNQQTDSSNLDLDADRGILHPCWDTKTSIKVDPVAVDILGYNQQ